MVRAYSIEALWTKRSIRYVSWTNHDELISSTIQNFESRYSRFLSWSILSQLNAKKSINADQEFLTLIHKWLDAFHDSWWFFSPFVWSSLVELGYDKQYSFEASTWWWIPESVFLIQDTILTLGPKTNFDLWGYGKGFLIDKIAEYFESQEVQNRIINGGGDIRFSWKDHAYQNLLGIPHATDPTLLIAERSASSWAIASSSSLVRNRGKHHHLIDPNTWTSTKHDVLSVSVFASTACLADIWATALYVWWEGQFDVLSEKLWVQYLALMKGNRIKYSAEIEGLQVYSS